MAEATAWFLQLERVCQTHIDAYSVGQPVPLSEEMARDVYASIGHPMEGWHMFQPYFHQIINQQPDVLT